MLSTCRRDYPSWRKGRERYLVWVIPITDDAWAGELGRAQTRLAPFLLNGYLRALHITVFVCGFDCTEVTFDDDFSPAAMSAQLDLIRSEPPRQFRLEALGYSSFRSAPVLMLSDTDSGLRALRKKLQPISTELRFEPYKPHVTLGLYQAPYATATVAQALKSLRLLQSGFLQVTRLQLVSYAAREISGEFSLIREFRLDT